MGASGRNIVKLITGSAVGAAVGALFARGTEATAKRDSPAASVHETAEHLTAKAEETASSGQGKLSGLRESLRNRWQRAQDEGDKAKEAREAELRAYFREKVDDPTAFPPGAPTRRDR